MTALWDFIDERSPRGGRTKGIIFVTHPGPSLLVTAVTVAAVSILRRHLADSGTIAALVLVVLPAQLATGALNDWADADADRFDKPFKPIARGAIGRPGALAIAFGGVVVSLAVGAWWGRTYLLIALLGAGSGVVYDLWLKRTAASVLCWWAGFEAIALLATTAAGAGGAVVTLPLSGLIAVALQVSNALPDADGDRRSGAATLPVVLGPAWSRAALVGCFGGAALYALLVGSPLHLGAGAVGSAAILAAATVVSAGLPTAVLRRAGFPVLAVLSAAAAISWLAALPGTPAV